MRFAHFEKCGRNIIGFFRIEGDEMQTLFTIIRAIIRCVCGIAMVLLCMIYVLGVAVLCAGVIIGGIGSVLVAFGSMWNALLGYSTEVAGLPFLPQLLFIFLGSAAALASIALVHGRVTSGKWKVVFYEDSGC